MLKNPIRRKKAAPGGELDCLFASQPRHDHFSAFYGDLNRRCDHGSLDELASAHMLYLYLGEFMNRR